MNTYGYVGGNPLSFTDSEGLARSGIPKKVPGTTTTVRIDKPVAPGQQEHAHIKSKGKPEVVINKDGTGSHGTNPKNIRNKKIIDFLKKKGFKVFNPVLIFIPNILEGFCNLNPSDPSCRIINPPLTPPNCPPDA